MTSQKNIRTAAAWISRELSNVRSTVDLYQQNLALNTRENSGYAFQARSFRDFLPGNIDCLFKCSVGGALSPKNIMIRKNQPLITILIK